MNAEQFLNTPSQGGTKAEDFLSSGGGEPTPFVYKALDFLTGHFPDKDVEPEVTRQGNTLTINKPESSALPFLQDPVTAVSFGIGAGLRPAASLAGRVVTGAREAVGWLTGGASEVPTLVKGGVKKIAKAVESPAAAERLKGWQAKGADVPLKAEEYLAGKVSPSLAKAPIEAANELQSAVIPGAKEVLEPASQTISRVFKSAANDIKRTFAPATMGKEAKNTAAIMRESLSDMAQRGDIAEKSLESARKEFNRMEFSDKVNFMDDIEKGIIKEESPLSPAATVIRGLLDTRRNQVQALGTGKLEHFYENYFPHIWKDPETATEMMRDWFARRPMEGGKKFLRERTVPTIKDGLQWRVYDTAGKMTDSFASQAEATLAVKEGGRIGKPLEMVSDNPVDLTILKLREMDKYIMAHQTINEMKDVGLAKFVKSTEKPPDGFAKIDDKIATVYGSGTLLDIRPSINMKEMYAGGKMEGLQLLGNYYAPEHAASIINNYLKPGLRNKEWFRGYLGLSNIMNQAQLGFSAFHLGFTSFDAAISKVALGLNQLVTGSPIKALKSIVESPAAPLTTVLKGNKVLKEWFSPGSQGEEIGKLVDALKMGGGRVRMDTFYRTRITEKMINAFKQGKLIGGVMRLPFAAVEMTARPIMEHLVPRQKLGVFMDLAQHEMGRLEAKGASRNEIRETMATIWSSVDNRMGQLVYDNLFWQRATKDLGMASVRSLGWNLGTFRELGGSAVDLTRQVGKVVKGQKPEMTYRMAYAMALPMVVGSIGGMTHYLMTGEPPTEMKDYFFPKTGRKDKDGNDERLSFPSYMKDVYHYAHTPGKAIVNKLHPALSVMGDMLRNQDFYGTEIRNAEDPIIQQALSEMKYVGKSMLPFSVQGALQRKKSGSEGMGMIAPFVGIMPAPKYIASSPMQNEIYETFAKRKGQGQRTQADFDKAHAKQEIAQLYKENKQDEFWVKVKEAVDKGYIENDETKLRTYLDHAKLPSDIKAFNGLPEEDQKRLIPKMSPKELEKYAWYAHQKVRDELGSLSKDANEFVQGVQSGAIKQQEYVAGYVNQPDNPKAQTVHEYKKWKEIGQ